MISRAQHVWRRLIRETARWSGYWVLTVTLTAAGADELPSGHKRGQVKGVAFQLNHFQVEGGSEEAARKYYREVLSPQMKFETPDTIEGTSITNLLAYFGYPTISATDLHRLGSDELMALSAAGDILATRFFAPKITDVQDKPVDIPKGGLGWRKLVRLNAKPGSTADNNGMQALVILQNVLAPSPTADPFDAEKNASKFNQAIATRRKLATGAFSPSQRAAYFFAYEPFVKIDKASGAPVKVDGGFQEHGRLGVGLQATFDETDRDPETNSNPKDYFVPESCENCHGKRKERGKLNFLDTDHWFDRVTPAYGLADPRFTQEDFTAVTQSVHGVLYDGGKDATTEKFNNAFAVIRKLNEEIKGQNADAGGPNNFQLNAVAKWTQLHASDTRHVPPYERGFGTETWNGASDNERILLYYLNRYCYRCHSSIKFNVFDREAVKENVGEIAKRVLELQTDYLWMPQDRIFPGLTQKEGVGQATGDLKEFLDLLKQLQ